MMIEVSDLKSRVCAAIAAHRDELVALLHSFERFSGKGRADHCQHDDKNQRRDSPHVVSF